MTNPDLPDRFSITRRTRSVRVVHLAGALDDIHGARRQRAFDKHGFRQLRVARRREIAGHSGETP